MTAAETKVLVVEDTGPCGATLEIALAQIAGVTVELVQTAEHARSVLSKGGVRAVVTDLQLPGSDGFELIEWVRSHEQQATRIAIVVVSGLADPDARSASLRKGADAYFSKPFSPAEVRRKVEELIHV